MSNPIGEAIKGIGSFDNLANKIREHKRENRLKGLLEEAGQGDTEALAELAHMSPHSAQVFMNQAKFDQDISQQATEAEEAAQQEKLVRMANYATQALKFEDIAQARPFIKSLINQEPDEEIKAELVDALNMDDDNLRNDLTQARLMAQSNLGELIDPLEEQKLDVQRLRLQQDATPKKTSAQKNFEIFQSLKGEAREQFGRKVGFISKEGQELSVHLQKRLSTATDEARSSRSNAAEFDGLANQFENNKVTGGLFGAKWKEAFKDLTGSQDAITSLRQRYFSIRASQVVKNLPPGSASDVDVALALSGFPSDNAGGEEIASFLRGLAKIERMNDEFSTFKAEYISEHGNERNMLKEWRSRQPSSDKGKTPSSDSNLTPAQKFEMLSPEEKEKVKKTMGIDKLRKLGVNTGVPLPDQFGGQR